MKLIDIDKSNIDKYYRKIDKIYSIQESISHSNNEDDNQDDIYVEIIEEITSEQS